MIGWLFAALTYLAAAGVIGSLLHEEGKTAKDYLIDGLTWPILYPLAIWLEWKEGRGGE
ncbi:hypothetical protein UFOVP679_10 [uncultured Caudovirales phage]|uniref:Uncharacterized protein n=1 Tax=uncultured Caudovirales phage TaxID=2100421 RepID=A0A6J5NEZ8_9CAUD|nr:hypothetical protein UFOVP679_10 [uncultured Caudovirales phage]